MNIPQHAASDAHFFSLSTGLYQEGQSFLELATSVSKSCRLRLLAGTSHNASFSHPKTMHCKFKKHVSKHNFKLFKHISYIAITCKRNILIDNTKIVENLTRSAFIKQ